MWVKARDDGKGIRAGLSHGEDDTARAAAQTKGMLIWGVRSHPVQGGTNQMNTDDTPSAFRREKRPFNATLTSTSSSIASSPERTRVTQACDHCRQRKTICDAQRPAYARCVRANYECTFLMPRKKRGPLYGSKQGVKAQLSSTVGQLKTSTTDTAESIQNLRLRQSWEARVQELEQRSWSNPSLDPFSKEVQDHLVEVFFEFCFEDFSCFSPARFLKTYSEGTLNPSLLNAVCAVAARFSNHPAVVTTPSSRSGEPFASRIRSRMGELVDEETIDMVHTLMLLGFYEYISGNHLRGYRFEGIAGRMATELQLHKAFAQRKAVPYTSEEERITTEIKVRTFAILLGTDCANSAVAGIPPLFDASLFEPWIVPYEADWWVESLPARGIRTYREEQLKDAAYVSILHKVLRPRPIRGLGDSSLTVPIIQVAISVWRFTNNGVVPETISKPPSATTMCSSSPSSPTAAISPLAPTPSPKSQEDDAKSTRLHWRESIPAIRKLDRAAENWRLRLSEELLPSKAKSSLWSTDINIIHQTLYYYILLISLYRPILLKAGMAAGNGEKEILQEKDGTAGRAEGTTNIIPDVDSTEMGLSTADICFDEKNQQFLRMALEKCYNAANEITDIIDQFSERLVRIRGSHLSFPIFIAGTVKSPAKIAQAKRGLLSCIRFFRMLGPYWAASEDQAMFLEDLLNTHTAKTEQQHAGDSLGFLHEAEERKKQKQELTGEGQKIRDELSNPVISAALALFEMNAPGATHSHHSGGHGSNSPASTVPSPTHAASAATNSNSGSPMSSRSSISTKSASTTTRFRTGPEEPDGGSSSAFLITDSGLGTIWREPEKLEALEKATLLSLERLSFLN
ncbi:MAG: hypothetical protein J3R72DRAFT_476942 [Linnemannia gamsii]|nr:MAG: hypothetical protein J3R72DRAFT_476942 [Linnemannia gamsii]